MTWPIDITPRRCGSTQTRSWRSTTGDIRSWCVAIVPGREDCWSARLRWTGDRPIVAANLALANGERSRPGSVGQPEPAQPAVTEQSMRISDHVVLVRRVGRLVRLAPGVQMLVTESPPETLSALPREVVSAEPTEPASDPRFALFRQLFMAMEDTAFGLGWHVGLAIRVGLCGRRLLHTVSDWGTQHMLNAILEGTMIAKSRISQDGVRGGGSIRAAAVTLLLLAGCGTATPVATENVARPKHQVARGASDGERSRHRSAAVSARLPTTGPAGCRRPRDAARPDRSGRSPAGTEPAEGGAQAVRRRAGG